MRHKRPNSSLHSPPPATPAPAHADLLDRFLAGDLEPAELLQLEQIAAQDPGFAAALAEARLLESTVAGALRGLASGAPVPVEIGGSGQPIAAVTDMAAVDLYLAGMLSQREVSGLLSDPASEAELVEALRYEALLCESLRLLAVSGSALTVSGIELVDRYLAGDLSAEEQAELFAYASDESAVTPALNEARACEAMLRDSLRRLASAPIPAMSEPDLSHDSPTLLDDLIDRSLAGALKQSELEELARYATASEAAGRKVAEAEAFSRLVGDALRLAAANAPVRPEPISSRLPMAPSAARSSLAHSRLRLQAASRRRNRAVRQSIGAVLAILLAAFAVFGILHSDWLNQKSNQDSGKATGNQPNETSGAGGAPVGTDTPVADSDSSALDANNPGDPTLDNDRDSEHSGLFAIVLPSAIVHKLLPNDTLPYPSHLRHDNGSTIGGEPDPGDTVSSTGIDPEVGPNSDSTDPSGETAVLQTLSLWPGEELAGFRVEAMDTLGRNLARLKRDDGLYRLWPEEQPDHSRRGGGRSKVSQDARVVHAVALQSHCLRVEIQLANRDATTLEAMAPSFEALRRLVREKRDYQLLTVRDSSGFLLATSEWHAALSEAGKPRRIATALMTEASEAARSLVNGIGKSGLWGEPNPESAYGTTSVSGSWSALVGRQVDSDILTTFAAVQGIEAALGMGVRVDPSPAFNRMVQALVASQSPVAEEVIRRLSSVDPNTGNAVLLEDGVPGQSRGWTVIGETMDGEGQQVLRSGAATAAAVYCLLVARDRMPATDPRYRRTVASIAPALEDGLTWLEVHFDGSRNPVDCGTGEIRGYTGDHANVYCMALRESMLRLNRKDGQSPMMLGHRAWHAELATQLLPGLAAGGTGLGNRAAFDTAMPVATSGNALWVVNDCLAALAAAPVTLP